MQHLTRDAIIGFVVLAAVGLGGIWYLSTRPAVQPMGPLPTATSSAPTATGPLHITESATYYDVDAQYPSSTALALSAGAQADAAAVAQMKQWETDTIAQFKNDSGVTNLTPEDIQIQGLSDTRKYALGITYETHSSAHTTSYIFQLYQDTLGAHPNTTYVTFVFDLTTGKKLSVAGLFPAGDGPKVLSALSRAKLPSQIAAASQMRVSDVDMGMLNVGTVADAANFEAYYFDGANFVLLFPPYAVGPYALGLVTLTVPASDVKGLSTRYP